MSHQAHAHVCQLRGLTRGEKAVLQVLAYYHNHQTGLCCPAVPTIAEDAEMSERQVIRLLTSLAGRGVLLRERPRDGRGGLTYYRFAGLERVTSARVQKGDIEGEKRVTSEPRKGDIGDTERVTFPAEKGDIRDSAIRNEQGEQEKQQENHHGKAALKTWLAIKRQLELLLPPDDYALWVRPMYLLKLMGGNLLLALPPSGEIIEVARKARDDLAAMARSFGYSGVLLTRYPDDWERSRLAEQYPEFAAKMLGAKKQPTGSRRGAG